MDREQPMKPAGPGLPVPAVLLVEDDPTSAAFMAVALEALPLRVELAGDCAQARAAVAAGAHALWLVDAHLPDGEGPCLFADLRALRPGVPALAHTASGEPRLHAGLRAAGFAGVLVKPVAACALRQAVAPHLGTAACTGMLPGPPVSDGGLLESPLPPWDDAMALAALGGERAHVQALRGLFLSELPAARAGVRAAADAADGAALSAALHRLSASCGFVGAAELAAAVSRLRAQPASAAALARFEQAVARLGASG